MDIQKIKKQLPVGAVKEISALTGVHYATVQGFISGKKTKKDIEIIEGMAEYLKEYKAKKKEATERLKIAVKERV